MRGGPMLVRKIQLIPEGTSTPGELELTIDVSLAQDFQLRRCQQESGL